MITKFLNFLRALVSTILLFDADIKVCIAHVEMLGTCKIITKSESTALVKGLKQVKKKYDDGRLSLSIKYEDVHMNIEQALI